MNFPYELGISYADGEWWWSVSFDDETQNQRGREREFPEAWRKLESAVRGPNDVAYK